MERGNEILYLLNALALSLCKLGNVSFLGGYELMERRIEETNGYGIAAHCLIDALKVSLLHRFKLCKSRNALFKSIGADHFAESGNTVAVKEHMLGTGKTDALCAKLTCLARICGSIRVCTNLETAVLVSPAHDAAELTRDDCVNRGDDAVVDVTGGTVDGNIIALMESLASQLELLIFFIHLDLAASGDTALAHTACNDRRMAGHTAANSEYALSGLHALNILRACLETDKNDLLILCCPCFCVFRCKNDLAAGSAGRCAETLAHGSCCLESLCVKLRMQKGIKVSGVDHHDRLLFIDHALVNEVACDLESSLSSTLAAAALKHIELAVLDGELHILHITVMILKKRTDLNKVGVCLGELLFHLGDGHGSADACNDIFALCIGKELAHQLLLAGGGITGERNAGTGIFVQVAEYHRHNVDGSAPGVGDVVVAAVNIRSGVVPGTENGLDSCLELFNGVGGEILTYL